MTIDINQISNFSIVVATKNQISSDAGDETIVLELEKGNYYGLGEVSSRVWQLIQQPISVEDLKNKILEEYEVSSEQCQQDLHQLLKKMLQLELIELSKSS